MVEFSGLKQYNADHNLTDQKRYSSVHVHNVCISSNCIWPWSHSQFFKIAKELRVHMGRVHYVPANLKRGLLTTSSIQTSFWFDSRSLGMLHIIFIMSWANSFLSKTLSLIMSGITPGKNFRAAPYNRNVCDCCNEICECAAEIHICAFCRISVSA